MACFLTRAASKSYIEPATQKSTSQQSPSRRRQPASRAPRRDYSKFSHATAGHKENCASCHLIPSFTQPDINNYPDHPSCTNCHRQQFFRGARPIICSNCHTVTAPRSEARFRFPKENAATQFADLFPHAGHVKTTSLLQFKKVNGEKANTQTTCMYCHKVNQTEFKPQPAAAAKETFLPAAGTFMTTPTSHTTCFQCHWQKGAENREQEPLSTQCSGCHQNIAKPATLLPALAASLPSQPGALRIIPAAMQTGRAEQASPSARTRPDAPQQSGQANLVAHRQGGWPERVSAKFVHEIEAHKKRANEEGKEVIISCLQCHVSVRKAASLEALRQKSNQVQLPTCSSSACHTALTGLATLKLSVYRELRERGKDAKFDCALCHTPPISLNPDVPCSHYATVLASAVKEKKSTKGIEQITPPRCIEAQKKEGQ